MSEKVYMQLPLELYHFPNKVCRFCQALYRFKQALRTQFSKISTIVSSLEYSINSYDSALFLCLINQGTVLLLLYVDDMIITGNDLFLF